MRRRRLAAALPLAVALDALAGLAPAPTSAPAGIRLRVVTLGVAPFGMIAADGAVAGLYVDLARALARESGIAFDIGVAPYPRAMAMMTAGDADLLFSIGNSQLQKVARPLAPVFSGDVIVIGRAGTRYASLAELRGKTVGVIRNAEYQAAFHDDAAIFKHQTSSIEQTVRMLLGGRLDAVIGFRCSLYYVLRALGQPRSRLGPELYLGQCPVLLYVSRQAPAARKAGIDETLARAMTALRERGEVARLLDRYFNGLPAQ